MEDSIKINCERLKEARSKRGLSQQGVVNRVKGKISLSTYRKYEYGERNPSFDNLMKISKVLNTNPMYLLDSDTILDAFSHKSDIIFETPYQYRYWHEENEEKNHIEVFAPDGTTGNIPLDKFLEIEKQIDDFIDMTFKKELSKNQK